jgi:polygalacturonase
MLSYQRFFLLSGLILLSGIIHGRSVNILEFGAIGDGKVNNTIAFRNAIDTCHFTGGGTVLVPPGVFLSGTIILRSHVNLLLEPGAVILGSSDLNDYFMGAAKVGLIYCEDAQNVSITGLGTIDGNGDVFMNMELFKTINEEGTMYSRQKSRFRQIEGQPEDGPVMPLDRPNQMIIFSNCRNVTIRDLVISNSPFWTLHLADVDGAVISGVRIYNNLLVPNSDGIDLTSCSNINVSDCDIRGGDDGFAITGYAHHFDLAGYNNIIHDSKNINVSNCNIVSRSSGIRIGGWDQNHMSNYNFNSINISNSNRGIVLTVRDSGSISDMNFNNIIIETRLHTGDWWGNGEPIQVAVIRGTPDVKLGTIKNLNFTNIIAKSEAGIVVYSSDESEIENIQFCDISLNLINSKLNDCAGGNFDLRPVSDPKFSLFEHDIPGFFAQGVKNLVIRNFQLTWDHQTQKFFTYGIEVDEFDGLEIIDFRGSASPSNAQLPPVLIRNGRGFNTNLGESLFIISDLK